MATSMLPLEIIPKKKMKEFRKVDGEEHKLAKKLKDYDFMPLNAKISEVLIEMRRNSEFRRPPKIPGNPPYKNEGKYCDFHEQAGHYTERCIALRLLIIEHGKLVRFLGEQRNQPRNNRSQSRQDY
jgi:hypothetical protein